MRQVTTLAGNTLAATYPMSYSAGPTNIYSAGPTSGPTSSCPSSSPEARRSS